MTLLQTIAILGAQYGQDMDKEFLSADEAAEMLQIHPRTLRRLLASGELPGIRIGRQWRISVVAVRKLIEGGQKLAPKHGSVDESEAGGER